MQDRKGWHSGTSIVTERRSGTLSQRVALASYSQHIHNGPSWSETTLGKGRPQQLYPTQHFNNVHHRNLKGRKWLPAERRKASTIIHVAQ